MDVKSLVSRLRSLHFALVTGVVFFVIISIFIQSKYGPFLMQWVGSTLCILVMLATNVFALTAIPLAHWYFTKRIKSLNKLSDAHRTEAFSSVYIIRLAVIELSITFFLIAYLLFGKGFYIVESVLLILLMIYHHPSVEKVERALK